MTWEQFKFLNEKDQSELIQQDLDELDKLDRPGDEE
jgi:hypothetical protein